MAMRLSGLMSGMDTESIIEQLVEARKTKVTTAKKAQLKLNYKQDAWKSLNTKLKNLQSKYLSTMRFSDAYSKKTTKVSNDSRVSVLTGENAVLGVQSLEVNQLAKTGYLTGGKVATQSGEDVTALTKLSELKGGFSGDGTINIKSGDKSVDIRLTADSTISDVLTQARQAGLNASFDAKQQRIFISAKESGADNDFSITAVDADGAAALSAMKLQVNLNQDAATLQEYQKYAGYFDGGDRNTTLANMQSMIDADVASKVSAYLEQYKTLTASRDAAQKKIDEINEKYKGSTLESADTYASQIESKNEEITKLQEQLDAKDSSLSDDDRQEKEKQLAQLKSEVEDLTTKKTDAETLASRTADVQKADGQIAEVEKYVTVQSNVADGNTTYTAEATQTLKGEVEDRYYEKAKYASEVIGAYDPDDMTSTGATKVSGQDAVITLNGATFENSTNVFEINGLTFTALSETQPGETVTVTTEQDTDGIYDMVKNFLKEYNSIINEMDKLYNAESAKGYEPLTSEEKEAMSESEIKEWEDKIKESILRRDENVNSVSSALKSVMSSGFEIDGKTYHLFDFGIETLGYFSSSDNEKNAYHIAGDPDDDATSGNADKLKSMIASDPDTVVSFFTKLSQTLYNKMSDLSKSVDGYRSFGSFYDDKKMKSEYDDYTSKIADLEQKLNDYEDSWYAKFSRMESAMAKMQQNANAVTSLLGG